MTAKIRRCRRSERNLPKTLEERPPPAFLEHALPENQCRYRHRAALELQQIKQNDNRPQRGESGGPCIEESHE